MVGPHPDDSTVCSRGHAWHHPLHVVFGRNVRPAPQRHAARRGLGHATMRCRVPGCSNEQCTFAHSENELEHWRAAAKPPSAHMFHPALQRALDDLGIVHPVTDNIREKLHARSLDEILRRVLPIVSSAGGGTEDDDNALTRRLTGGGYADLLRALRAPAPPRPAAWDAWAWPQWDALRRATEYVAAQPPLSPHTTWHACGAALLEQMHE